MAITVQQYIIDPAFKLLGLIAAGRSMATAEYADALDCLNELLDATAAQGELLFQITRETFPLTGAATYTMGAGGIFSTARPVKLRAAAVLAANNTSHPVELVSAEKFGLLPDRTLTGIFADWLACDYAAPVANLYLNPAPVAGNLELWSLKALTAFATIGDTLALPPGYDHYLKFNLAVNIAGQFAGAKLTQQTIDGAQAARAGLAKLYLQTLGETGPIETPAVRIVNGVTTLQPGAPPLAS